MDFSRGIAPGLAVVAERLARTSAYWPRAVAGLLAAVVAYQLVALTGTIISVLSRPAVDAIESAPAAAVPRSGDATPPSHEVATSGLVGAHLFGEAAAAPAEAAAAPAPTVEAPPTSLDLRLTGILLSHAANPSQVIIAGGGSEKVYGVGDSIDGANGATVRAVLADHAILERDARFESLWLPREVYARDRSAPLAPPPVIAARPATGLESSHLGAVKAAVAAKPAAPPRLSEIMLVGPQLDETGAAAGFALSPGRDITAFNQLGLQAGDRVINVNGVDLGRDPNEGPRIFKRTLGSATTASLTVMRDDAYETILIDSNRLLN